MYRAARRSDGREVALKTIVPAVGATRRQVERSVREARILSALRHPHVVGFEEVGEAGRKLVHVSTEDPVPLRDRRPDGLAAVHRALAREPAARFPDVAALRAALVPFA